MRLLKDIYRNLTNKNVSLGCSIRHNFEQKEKIFVYLEPSLGPLARLKYEESIDSDYTKYKISDKLLGKVRYDSYEDCIKLFLIIEGELEECYLSFTRKDLKLKEFSCPGNLLNEDLQKCFLKLISLSSNSILDKNDETLKIIKEAV